MGFDIRMVQTQKLIMTPQLKQAIAILQMSTLELHQYIDQQLQGNPILELQDEHPSEEVVSPSQQSEPPDWQEYFQDRSDLGLPGGQKESKEGISTYENMASPVPTLAEHLSSQLQLSLLGDAEREIAEYLLGLLDERGYLPKELDEVYQRFAISTDNLESIISVLHTFDPAGIAARDLHECLRIQLDHLGIDNPVVDMIIEHYLDDLASGKMTKIAQALGRTVLDVQEAVDLIRTLDPKPGSKYGNPNDNRYITPDLVVEKVNSDYVVMVNDQALPRLTLSRSYQNMLHDSSLDQQTASYLQGKMEAAIWLTKSIEQRRLTLYRVMECIVERQRAFFDHGIHSLTSLTLRDVAEQLQLHESTISRATSNKYVQTPRGIFELKFFFAHGLESSQGGITASESVKRQLQEMVNNEDTKRPLSDQSLAEMLGARGITISRRTVAKYREEMGIPASAKRKRYV